MSKHKTAEDKLHVSNSVKPQNQGKYKDVAKKVKVAPPAPPKGTNAYNQYR
jgi:hypothetical protein